MKTITKIGVVGGLLAALGTFGTCKREREEDPYIEDVKALAGLHDWENITAARKVEDSAVCQGMDLYEIVGISPEGENDSAYVCCGRYGGSACQASKVDCKFLETNTNGGQ